MKQELYNSLPQWRRAARAQGYTVRPLLGGMFYRAEDSDMEEVGLYFPRLRTEGAETRGWLNLTENTSGR